MTSPLRYLLALSVATTLPFSAQAHRMWLLPSATVLSGQDTWVTVDAAVSNDVFFFEHMPLALEDLTVTAPNGQPAAVENRAKGRYRSTFDLQLTQSGTYRLAVVASPVMASFKVGGETKRVRGTAETVAKQIPPGATDLSVSRSFNRVETFVTAGKPGGVALAPVGVGLEMVPVSHPNDLVVGQPATFRFYQDGQPAAKLEVSVIPGGIRYRDKLEEQTLVTDDRGEVRVHWKLPGMHWLNAAPPREASAGRVTGSGTLDKPILRYNYVGTLEVLAQ